MKKNGRWSAAEKWPEPINSDTYECGFSFAKGDRLYFACNGRPDGKSNQCDIYCCNRSNGIYQTPVNLDSLNTERSECTLAVEPDEKYIIFTRYFNKMGRNAVDLFISFHKKDGTWTEAQRLDPPINSPGSNHTPTFSPDGKYFFFQQSIQTPFDSLETNPYWVSTRLFDAMRKKVVH